MIKQILLPKPPQQRYNRLIKQILTITLQERPFDETLASKSSHLQWTTESVSEVLRSLFHEATRSIESQKNSRRKTPPKNEKFNLGLNKAIDFFFWVEDSFGFSHSETTVRELAVILARGHRVRPLWSFLKEITSNARENKTGLAMVRTSTVTCLIKVLGEEGMSKDAFTTFKRMKQFYCKPDVEAYNATIEVLCRANDFNAARYLLEQMELPGSSAPSDVTTYTILVKSYCRYALYTTVKKAVGHRLWFASKFFREIEFRGLTPDVEAYNVFIDGLCRTYRIERALELFDDMEKRGGIVTPNRRTYNCFVRFYSKVNKINEAIKMTRRMKTKGHGRPNLRSYTLIIHAMCHAGRAVEARELLAELIRRGLVPRERTYKLVHNALKAAGEPRDSLDEGLSQRVEDRAVTKVTLNPS